MICLPGSARRAPRRASLAWAQARPRSQARPCSRARLGPGLARAWAWRARFGRCGILGVPARHVLLSFSLRAALYFAPIPPAGCAPMVELSQCSGCFGWRPPRRYGVPSPRPPPTSLLGAWCGVAWRLGRLGGQWAGGVPWGAGCAVDCSPRFLVDN